MKNGVTLRRALLVVLAAILAVGLASCAAPTEEETAVPEQTATPEPVEQEPQGPVMALIMAGDTAFNRELAAQAGNYSVQAGYELLPFFSASAEQQETDFYTAIGKGIEAIILIPVDEDTLQTVVEQTETMRIPIINALNPVNGVVTMLVSPDYQLMGSMAAEQVGALKPDGAQVLTLEEAGTAFISQMIHDGFVGRAAELGSVTVSKSVIVENNADVARERTLAVLDVEAGIDVICAQSEELALGALSAVSESGREVSIIVCGGSADAMEKVESGQYAACIFTSPTQLAELAVSYAAQAAAGTAVPQYAAMRIEVITPENVAQHKQAGAYADLILPEPTPEPTETPGPGESGDPGATEKGTPETDTPEPDETDTPETQ